MLFFPPEQTLGARFYLHQAWIDPRLAFDNEQFGFYSYRIPNEFIDRIWKPNTYFRNAKRVEVRREPTDERVMWINARGHVLFSQRYIWAVLMSSFCDNVAYITWLSPILSVCWQNSRVLMTIWWAQDALPSLNSVCMRFSCCCPHRSSQVLIVCVCRWHTVFRSIFSLLGGGLPSGSRSCSPWVSCCHPWRNRL